MASGVKVTKNFTGIDRILRESPERQDQAVRGAAQAITSDIVLSMGTSPPGRSYTRGGITHTASLPGYPPTPDIGNLKASMRWEPDGHARALVMDQTEYGYYLEAGTAKMAARPFFSPVFEKWRQGEFETFLRGFEIIR